MILSKIPEQVYISLFTSDEEYMVVSNMTDAPYTVELRDLWVDRESDKQGRSFEVPSKRIIFLQRLQDEAGV